MVGRQQADATLIEESVTIVMYRNSSEHVHKLNPGHRSDRDLAVAGGALT